MYGGMEAQDDKALKVKEVMVKDGEDWQLVPNVQKWKFAESA